MRFETTVHYTGSRTSEIEANHVEDATQLARNRHRASRGPGEIEEIVTHVDAEPIDEVPRIDPYEQYDLVCQLARRIGVCPECGADLAVGAPAPNCGASDGCGAVNGNGRISYELAQLERLLYAYVHAVRSGSYQDIRHAVGQIALDMLNWPVRAGAPEKPKRTVTIEITVDDLDRLDTALTLAVREDPKDPAYGLLRGRLSALAEATFATTLPA